MLKKITIGFDYWTVAYLRVTTDIRYSICFLTLQLPQVVFIFNLKWVLKNRLWPPKSDEYPTVRCVKFQFWNHENLAYTLGSTLIKWLCRGCSRSFVSKLGESLHGWSLISIVVNCCQISIVPRMRPKWSLHCIYCIFHSVSITTILLFYFILFHDNGMPMKERKLYALSSWRYIIHPWCKLCMLLKYIIKLWMCN